MSQDQRMSYVDQPLSVNTEIPLRGPVELVDHDPSWAAMYTREAVRIRQALGDRALLVEHIGSTAVPGLCAKPCIDISLGVADPADEKSYLPDLEAAGYILRRREPDWHQHRVFKGPDINVNLHVWTYGDPIIRKHLAFRDWLRAHPDDRDRYAAEKQRLARQDWEVMNDYAEAKNDIVREIERRMWAHELEPLGTVTRLQMQREKIKSGMKPDERYTPDEHLLSVAALCIDDGGVTGITSDGERVPDVHHRDHPRSRFRGANGVSIGFTGHYVRMRERFGAHLVDGIAGESILVGHEGIVSLDTLVNGIVITGGDGRIVEMDTWEVADPCAPFSKFCLRFPPGQKPDRRVTGALQFLAGGTRGFYGTYRADQPQGVIIRVGDTVYRRR